MFWSNHRESWWMIISLDESRPGGWGATVTGGTSCVAANRAGASDPSDVCGWALVVLLESPTPSEVRMA